MRSVFRVAALTILCAAGSAIGCTRNTVVQTAQAYHSNLPGRNFAAVGVTVDTDGMVLAGSAVAPGSTDLGPESWDAWIAGYGEDGAQRWERFLGGDGYDTITGVAEVDRQILAVAMHAETTSTTVHCLDLDGVELWRMWLSGEGRSETGRIAASDHDTVLITLSDMTGVITARLESRDGAAIAATELPGGTGVTHFLEIDGSGAIVAHGVVPDAATIFDTVPYGEGWIAGGAIGWNELGRRGPGVLYRLDESLNVAARREIPGTAVAVSGVWADGTRIGVGGHYREDVDLDGDVRMVPRGSLRGGFVLDVDANLRTVHTHHLVSDAYVIPHDGVFAPDGTERIVGVYAGSLRNGTVHTPRTTGVDDTDGFVLWMDADGSRFTTVAASGHQTLTSFVVGTHQWVVGAADALPRAYWPDGSVVGGLDGIALRIE